MRFREKMDSYEDAILDQRCCSGFVRKKAIFDYWRDRIIDLRHRRSIRILMMNLFALHQ